KEHLEDGWEASQTRPRRGHVGKENWKGYSYFQCVKCGYECDRDRNSSRNTALGGATALGRAALGRPLKARLPRAGMHVMASVRSHEGASSQRHIA
ncbi:TPA: hypothetical protein EYP44_01720, partial [Candidatus Bathyarchaeota archaeon]|nr:hypothetical protein [Candidatus Bathyarchaeota archaeon]